MKTTYHVVVEFEAGEPGEAREIARMLRDDIRILQGSIKAYPRRLKIEAFHVESGVDIL